MFVFPKLVPIPGKCVERIRLGIETGVYCCVLSRCVRPSPNDLQSTNALCLCSAVGRYHRLEGRRWEEKSGGGGGGRGSKDGADLQAQSRGSTHGHPRENWNWSVATTEQKQAAPGSERAPEAQKGFWEPLFLHVVVRVSTEPAVYPCAGVTRQCKSTGC